MSPRVADDGRAPGPELRAARAPWLVWLVRVATAAMLLAAIGLAARKFRTTPEQEELARYVELTVPGYLRDVAGVEETLDRLAAGSKLSATEARALLVDEAMPAIARARRRATSVGIDARSVRAENDEYVAALDRLLEAARAGVRAIDDPTVSAEAGHAAMRSARRQADDTVRAFMAHLRDRCVRAGLRVDVTAAAPATRR